jgi:glycosyltransferase involved in cell wall biosynthesis
MTQNETSINKRFLYLIPGPLPPNSDPKLSKFFNLSFLSGDILSPVWWKNKSDAENYFGKENFPIFKVNNFNYHFIFVEHFPTFIRPFIKVLLFIIIGIKLRVKNGKYDYIMSYGTNSTGLACIFLKYINGAQYIAEIPGVPEDGSKLDNPPILEKKLEINQFIMDLTLKFVCSQANRIKLLYETQLLHYPSLNKIKSSIFHDFVATNSIELLPKSDDKFILTLGFPWYRKGTDVLIRAFNLIEKDFPDHKLFCVGWYLNKEPLLELAKNHPRINIMKQVTAAEAYKLISTCSVFVLPSRSEAMGRVLIEAMAAKKPIIASQTNGIPTYIKDEFNGLLVPPGDEKSLSLAISKVLSNKQYALELGVRGYQYMKAELNEDAYVRKFKQMIDDIDEGK